MLYRIIITLVALSVACGSGSDLSVDGLPDNDAQTATNNQVSDSGDVFENDASTTDPDADEGFVTELDACPVQAFDAVPTPQLESTYFVSVEGDDEADGTSLDSAFATVQKGVDALEPGDTLTIMPGEYFGTVRREELGSNDATTTIKAAIPGTVVLRGDIEAPEFSRLEGTDFVWVADFESEDEIQAVNERDTLTIFEHVPNFNELEFTPGRFYQDRDAGKLYISTSDRDPTYRHHYTLSMTTTHGVYLSDARQVVIDGIAVTGFHSRRQIHQRDGTNRAIWGLFISQGQGTIIRNVEAYLNAHGIGTLSSDESSGDNVIEGAIARGNSSDKGIGDIGGITMLRPRRDVVTNSISYKNRAYGINIRGGGAAGTQPENRSFMRNSIAWGNGHDIRLKTGSSHIHRTQNMVALGSTADSQFNPENTIMGTTGSSFDDDTIVLDREDDLELEREFADPVNFDFRLQATSRFRGAASDGSDRGAYPYEENIYYVSTQGDDGADGLSVENAFASIDRALEVLEAGDTLYLLDGTYDSDFSLDIDSESDAPLRVRTRGEGTAILTGDVTISGSNLEMERLIFGGAVSVDEASAVTLRDNWFGIDGSLRVNSTSSARIYHNLFVSPIEGLRIDGGQDIHVVGNYFDNRDGVGLRIDTPEALSFADYNAFKRARYAWRIGDGACDLGEVGAGFEAYSEELVHEPFTPVEELENPRTITGRSLHARHYGPTIDRRSSKMITFEVEPHVRSTSATTANIEWLTNLPVEMRLSWGPTEATENDARADANYFGSFSLTGLEPDTTYFVRLESMGIPDKVDIKAGRVEIDTLLSFTTAADDPDPTTWYVATDGDDANAGTSRDQAFASVQKAANETRPGDTVEISGGTYYERVRVRSTGAADAPITFKATAGERVVFDGGGEQELNHGFVVTNKAHLRFDGFMFQNYNSSPGSTTGWMADRAAEFSIHRARDVVISRCISDGRGTSSTARTVVAEYADDLHIHNCVSIDKMSGSMLFNRVDNLIIERSVILRPKIAMLLVRRPSNVQIRDMIFTDMLRKKAEGNGTMFQGSSDIGLDNNTYYLREFDENERHFFGSRTYDQISSITNPLFVDPIFQGALDLIAEGQERDFMPDAMLNKSIEYDFDFFMATHPDVVDRGMGLNPDLFTNGLPN